MHIYTTVSYYTMDSEHTIDSDIGVTGDETVPVEKPEEDVSKSSDNIEAEEAMFAAVHKLFNMRIGGTLPPRLTARSRSEVVVIYLYELGLHYTSSPCCLHCADNCILAHSNCILLL